MFHLQLFAFDLIGATGSLTGEGEESLWEHDLSEASTKLNGMRLQTQMFAFLVTAQLGNAFQELAIPYIARWFQSRFSPPTKVKRAGDRPATQEEKMLDRVNKEVSMGMDYDIFDDYCEMVTQFGYIAMWSSIWPLAPGECFLRRWLSVGDPGIFVQLWPVSITGSRDPRMRSNSPLTCGNRSLSG